MRDFDAVLFDLDDTLHDDTAAYRSAARQVALDMAASSGVDAGELERGFVAQVEGFWSGLTDEQLRSKLPNSRLRLWGAALAEVGVHDAVATRRCADDYTKLRSKAMQLLPGAAELLADLRGSGRKLGLLTNGFSETHREKIALLKLEDAFDVVVIADEIGMLKPDPLFFLHACQELDVAPARTVMVGDRYGRDVRGGQAAGMRTIWMNVRNESVPPGAPAPDVNVSNLAGVRAALLGG